MKLRLSVRRRLRLSNLRAFWREIEPGLSIDRNNLIERWDSRGEGRATSVSFEGFGVTGMLFIGRTPPASRACPAAPTVTTATVPADEMAVIGKAV